MRGAASEPDITMKLLAVKGHELVTLRLMTSNGRQFSADRCCTLRERAVEGGLILLLESQRVFSKICFCFV